MTSWFWLQPAATLGAGGAAVLAASIAYRGISLQIAAARNGERRRERVELMGQASTAAWSAFSTAVSYYSVRAVGDDVRDPEDSFWRARDAFDACWPIAARLSTMGLDSAARVLRDVSMRAADLTLFVRDGGSPEQCEVPMLELKKAQSDAERVFSDLLSDR